MLLVERAGPACPGAPAETWAISNEAVASDEQVACASGLSTAKSSSANLCGGRLIFAGQIRRGDSDVNCCAIAMPARSPALRAPSPRLGDGARTRLPKPE